MVLYYASSERNDELYHHGVKGQKWGVRRYQNVDGSLTVAGRQRQKETRRIRQSNQTIGNVRDIEDSLSSEDLYNLGYDKGTTEPGWHNSPDHGKSIVKRFLVYDGDKAVSYADLEEFTSDYKKILNVVIATKAGEENRGKGHATQALDQCVKWFDRNAVKNGYAEINYGVRESNTASRKLAEKAGFKARPSSEKGWVDYVYTTPKAQFAAEVGAVKACCSTKADQFKKQPIDRDTVKKRGDLNDEEANTCIRLANRLYDKASKEEPKITSDITKVAASSGSSMYGLEYRLKQPTSLAGKIGSDAKGDDTSFYDAAKGIKDAVRYTVVSNGSEFVKSYNSVKAKMESQGYTEVRCKNFFEKYRAGEVQHKAVQCSFESPNGYIFEVQFQTPESQAAKELKVPLYEERRQKGISTDRAAELEKQMRELAEKVPYPPDIAAIASHNKPETKHSTGDDMDAYFATVVDDYTLSHHGIKGMHWYHRRFQNEDGSYTAAGKARYGIGQAAKAVATAPVKAVKSVGGAVKKKIRSKWVDYLTRDLQAYDKNVMKLSESEKEWAKEKYKRKNEVADLTQEQNRIARKNSEHLSGMLDSGKKIADVISSVAIGRTLSDLAQERTGFEPIDEKYWKKQQAKAEFEQKQVQVAEERAKATRQLSYNKRQALEYGEILSKEADDIYAKEIKDGVSDTQARKDAALHFTTNFRDFCDYLGIEPSDVYESDKKKDKKKKKPKDGDDDEASQAYTSPTDYFAAILSEDSFDHYGVKGMKWYVRRYQPYPLGEAKGKVIGDAAAKARARMAPVKKLLATEMPKSTQQIAKELRAAKVAKMTKNLKTFKKNSHLLSDAEYEAAMKKFTRKEDIAKMQESKFARSVNYVKLVENAVNSTKSVADNVSLITTGYDLKTNAKKRRNPFDSEYYKDQSAKFDAEIKRAKSMQEQYKEEQEQSKMRMQDIAERYAETNAKADSDKKVAEARAAQSKSHQEQAKYRQEAAKADQEELKRKETVNAIGKQIAEALRKESADAEEDARNRTAAAEKAMRDLGMRDAYKDYQRKHPNSEMSFDRFKSRFYGDDEP